jgi:hypothetical protein
VPLLKLRPDVRPSFAMRFGEVVEELESRQSLAGSSEQVAKGVHVAALPRDASTEATAAAAAALPELQVVDLEAATQGQQWQQQQQATSSQVSSNATALVDAIADRKFDELLTEALDEAVLLCSPVKHRTPGPQQQQQQAGHMELGESASSSSDEGAASVEAAGSADSGGAGSDGGSSSCSRSLQPDWQSDVGSPSPWASPLSVSKWTAAAAAGAAAAADAGQSHAGEVHEAEAAVADAAEALELRGPVCRLEPLLDGSCVEGESCHLTILSAVHIQHLTK